MTDPSLSTKLIDRLARHGDAQRALADVTGTPGVKGSMDFLQLTVLGRTGPGYAFSGS
ncbi:hypothetical protein [Streptomyces griseiscabiei]|uniref:Uncharacterized protein n=1 Tax=Streptomyces griseiscabiei TaxID=2993540 RepID=A0ABU4LKG7_9ACTN|nr:hypothetical protein [Streptomyces griseiscabiei]MDX2916310.1 hypothetical protein [Streptomyces griseiscabiei]